MNLARPRRRAKFLTWSAVAAWALAVAHSILAVAIDAPWTDPMITAVLLTAACTLTIAATITSRDAASEAIFVQGMLYERASPGGLEIVMPTAASGEDTAERATVHHLSRAGRGAHRPPSPKPRIPRSR